MRPQSRRTLLLLALAQGVMMTGTSLLMATAVLVGYTLAADKAYAALPLALQFLATMGTTVPASQLMRHIGRRGGFVVGSLIGAAGGAIAAVAILHHMFGLFCFGTVLIGVFNGFGNYYRFAAADTVEAAQRSRAISWVLAGGVLAAFAGPNLAAWTRDLYPGALFAASYAAMAALYLLNLLAVWLMRIPHVGEYHGRGPAGRSLRQVAAQPRYRVALFGAAVGYGVMVLVMTATPLSMRGDGFPFGDTALVIQWHVFAMFAPAFVTGNLINRFGAVAVMAWGALLNLGCVAVDLTGVSVPHYWFALVMLGVGWNFLFVGATALLTETYTPAEKAKAQALNDFIVFSCVGLASLCAGALQYRLGWRAVNVGVAPLIVLVLASLHWLRRIDATAGQEA